MFAENANKYRALRAISWTNGIIIDGNIISMIGHITTVTIIVFSTHIVIIIIVVVLMANDDSNITVGDVWVTINISLVTIAADYTYIAAIDSNNYMMIE